MNERHKNIFIISILLIGILLCQGLFINSTGASGVTEIDTDKWADAIFKAEGEYKATYLYGIRSIPYDTERQARKYCKNTIYNTLIKYRSTRCKENESNIDCMARRYCPQGSDTDNGTCQYWKKNVIYFLGNK